MLNYPLNNKIYFSLKFSIKDTYIFEAIVKLVKKNTLFWMSYTLVV